MPHHLVYLVEDHLVMQQAYADLIDRMAEFTLCGTATSAEEALETLPKTDCDLVVADISLPGMDGIEFVRRLRDLLPDMRAVVISGHDDPSVARRAHEAGAVVFLGKAALVGQLAETLRRAADGPADVRRAA